MIPSRSVIRFLAVAAIVISLGTWAADIFGLVYVCPYCRVERTVIGLLGVLMLPAVSHWAIRYIATVFGVLGLVVASTQNFLIWKKIFKSAYVIEQAWYFDPFLLSGAALFIITGQVMLINSNMGKRRSI